MNDKKSDPHERTVPMEKRRGGGRPLPRPAGTPKRWQPPTNGTAPADRNKQTSNKEK